MNSRSNNIDNLLILLKTITSEIDCADNETINNVKLIATMGWPLSLTIPLPDFNEKCSQLQHDELKLDEYLFQYYSENSELVFSEFENLIKLFSTYNLAVFKQARECFYNERHEICITALFSLIEGSLLHFTNGDREPTKYNDKYIKSLLRQQNLHFYTPLIYSLSSLLDYYFKPINFNAPEPSSLNRHWSQHGRLDKTSLGKKDVIKLFLFLELVNFTKLCLDDNEKMLKESSEILNSLKERMKPFHSELPSSRFSLHCEPNK